MCGLEEDLDQIWKTIEGSTGDRPDDAEHWVRVYEELVTAGEAILAERRARGEEAPGSGALDRRVAVFRGRLQYWRAELEKGSGPDE